jgi:hypothetical protein
MLKTWASEDVRKRARQAREKEGESLPEEDVDGSDAIPFRYRVRLSSSITPTPY